MRFLFFFFKQKTAYEMRISDWSSDVCSSDLAPQRAVPARWLYDRRGSELFEAITDLPEYYPTRTETRILTESGADIAAKVRHGWAVEIGRAACRERVCQCV